MTTDFRAWEVPANKANNLAFLFGYVLQDIQECAKSQVAYLAPPKALHSLEIQVFKKEVVVAVSQLVCQLEKPVKALIGYPLVDLLQNPFSLAPVAAPFDLAGQGPVSAFDFVQALLKKLRRFYRVGTEPIADSEERFQAKIESRHFTGRGFWPGRFNFQRKAQVQLIQRIALDCDRLNVTNQGPVLAQLVGSFAYLNPAVVQQFPTGLFQSVALELGYLPKRRWSSFSATLAVVKEKLIAFLDSLDNVLKRLGGNQVEPVIPWSFLELCQVFHQGILVKVLAGQLIVPLVQSYAVVIRLAGQVDRPMKMFILFRSVELVLVGDSHWFF